MIPIKGSTDFDSAHFIPDYPAGFTARVTKKMWIETDPKKGQRSVANTSQKGNPNKWCAPKKSTYDDLIAIGVVEASDIGTHGFEVKDVGHAHFIHCNTFKDAAYTQWFNTLFGPFETEYERGRMMFLLAYSRADLRVAEWVQESPKPEYDYQPGPVRDAYNAWDQQRQKVRQEFFLDEVARIKANDEVPEPKDVAPAQTVPAGAMCA
jgi:hypothetical protein